RIEEELERAKRFDLRLSLVLIDVPRQVPGAQDALAQLHETVRRELRGSDVLGKMGGQRVAALLTHTDAPASHKVVGRLHRLLAGGCWGRRERPGATGVGAGGARPRGERWKRAAGAPAGAERGNGAPRATAMGAGGAKPPGKR